MRQLLRHFAKVIAPIVFVFLVPAEAQTTKKESAEKGQEKPSEITQPLSLAVAGLTSPTTKAFAGSAGGTVSPDLFSGLLSVGIPLVVPPGRGVTTPALSLIYRVSQQSGWLGVGWNLELDSIGF